MYFLGAMEETMWNIHKKLSIVYGNGAVDGSTVGRWVKGMRDGEVGPV
jgi:hypothetical protein